MTVEERAEAAAPPDADEARPAEPADVVGLPDTALRSALDFAVGIAAAGQKLRPPLAFPSGMKPHLRFERLDRPALSAVRRAVAGDETFRSRLGEVATTDLVDELGIAWLQRRPGWQERIVDLHRAAQDDAEQRGAEAALRKAERRREAAEAVAARANAELIGHHDLVAREQVRREKAEHALAASAAETASVRTELTGVRRELERLRQQLDNERATTARGAHQVAELTERLHAVEALRDEMLASRAAHEVTPTAAVTPVAPTEAVAANRAAARALHDAAAATRDLANALAAASDALSEPSASSAPGPTRSSLAAAPAMAGVRTQRGRQARKPIAIPGGVYGDSMAAATHLLRTPQVVLLVDGYNVAKLAWPALELSDQRERCIDLLEDVARRHGTDIHVVFDGADVVGASARRRLIRVQFSPAGVSADDVIRAEVGGLPVTTPVVVVTNDQAIVGDVRSEGANVVASDMLLSVAGRSIAR